MRIQKILLRNYRQFRDIEISFDRNTERDLHIIIGGNTAGKTNILNAINWCLYAEEPHLTEESQQLPRLNLNTIRAAESEKKEQVMVELWTEANGNFVTFVREELYLIHENNEPTLQSTKFQVRVRDEKGNTKMLDEEESISYVERFVPKRIREFFFFDVERLDNYFKGVTVQQIRHAIFQISQLNILTRVENKLDRVLSDLRKEASKHNPRIDKVREELEEEKEELKGTCVAIEECNHQIGLAAEKIKEYEDNLRGFPDTEKLQKEKGQQKEQRSKTDEIFKQKIREKQDALFEYGKILMLYSGIEKTIQIIQEKREHKEIPPPVDPRLLKRILQDKLCICKRPVEPESEEARRISELEKEIAVSSTMVQALQAMESSLHHLKERARKFKTSIGNINNEVNRYAEEIQRIDSRIEEIDNQLGGYDSEKISVWVSEQKAYEHTRDVNQQKLGALKGREQSCVQNIEVLNKEFTEGIKKETKVKEINKHINFVKKAIETAQTASLAVMEAIRKQIEDETKHLFFELIWRKETYVDVTIDEDYDIHLRHSRGYDCLGTISAAERELLTLAFILALHSVSGFDSPILIDTPLTRVSDQQRENFASALARIDPKKQLILLFTISEYSTEASKFLDPASSNKFVLKLSSDEQEAHLEVL